MDEMLLDQLHGTIDRIIGMIFSRFTYYGQQAIPWYIDLSDIIKLIGYRRWRVGARLINGWCVHGCQMVGTMIIKVRIRNPAA
jgi:hypothetical protein